MAQLRRELIRKISTLRFSLRVWDTSLNWKHPQKVNDMAGDERYYRRYRGGCCGVPCAGEMTEHPLLENCFLTALNFFQKFCVCGGVFLILCICIER